MTIIKVLIVMAITIGCASLLLLGGGMERIGQVALTVYAALICLTLFAKEDAPRSAWPVMILGRLSYAYVVAVSAYTGHMVLAFILAIAWVLGWSLRTARQIAKDKEQSKPVEGQP